MNMAQPAVKMVIAAFNAAATIERAVDFVFAQTYDDYEIVIADDSSRDATGEIVAAYQNDKMRLPLLPQDRGWRR